VEQARDLARLVLAVPVHQHDRGGAKRDRPLAPGAQGQALAEVDRMAHHARPGKRRRVHGGPRAVVHDHDLARRHLARDPRHHRGDPLAFVVRGDHHERAAGRLAHAVTGAGDG